MAQPRRPESPLKLWIQTYWLQAWKHHKPDGWSFHKFWDLLMRTGRRHIHLVKAQEGGTMPGDAVIDGYVIEGLKLLRQRGFKAGDIIFIREDVDEPYVELETAGGIFRLKRCIGTYQYVQKTFGIRLGNYSERFMGDI